MSTATFAFCWVNVWLVAGFDCAFMWVFRSSVAEWETNPLMRNIATEVGVPAVFVTKLGLLGFAQVVAICLYLIGHKRASLLTMTVFEIHLLLALVYFVQLLPR